MESEMQIREYLLGQLAPEDCVQIEQRIMTDVSFLEQVRIIETELIDDYLEDSLSDEDAFCKSFLSTAYGRRKVSMAMALTKCLSIEAAAKVSEQVTKGMPLWKRFLVWGSA
jgi:hypothetical protein